MSAPKRYQAFSRIFMVVAIAIFTLLVSPLSFSKLSGSLSYEAIQKRMQPLGQVEVEGVVKKKVVKKTAGPVSIYDNNCATCHKSGIAGAPKLGDKAAWQSRLSQGIDTLTKKAIAGFGAMPPKGNCFSCSDDDIRKTVEYMISTVK